MAWPKNKGQQMDHLTLIGTLIALILAMDATFVLALGPSRIDL